MASESNPEQRRWLVEPPGAGEISFQIAAGDQAEITPEIRQALDGFIEALGGNGDVEGFTAPCLNYIKGCTTNKFVCTPRRTCNAESQVPNCFVEYNCLIAPTAP